MQTRSSTSTVLIALIILFTFPLWIGLVGAAFGIVAGVFGAVIGLFAGLFGAMFGALGAVVGWIFDWHWHFDWPFGFFNGKLLMFIMVVLVIFIISKPRTVRK